MDADRPPEIVELEDLYGRLLQVAGFALPSSTRTAFEALSAAADRDDIRALLSSGSVGGRNWHYILKESLVDTRYGLGAVNYHLENIEDIENAIATLRLEAGNNFTVGNFRANRLDYEYQAYLFSLRRAMEYFGNSVGAMFKCQIRSVREVSNSIKNAVPVELRDSVIEALDSGLERLSDILPPRAERDSARDTAAHTAAVPAGRVRLMFFGGKLRISIEGGGEDLQRAEITSETRLSPVLREQVDRVETMMYEIYSKMGLL